MHYARIFHPHFGNFHIVKENRRGDGRSDFRELITMSNRWAKRTEESEYRVTTHSDLLEALNTVYTPTCWSWTRAQELDGVLTTQMEFNSQVYERYGVKPEPAATRLINDRLHRNQKNSEGQAQAQAPVWFDEAVRPTEVKTAEQSARAQAQPTEAGNSRQGIKVKVQPVWFNDAVHSTETRAAQPIETAKTETAGPCEDRWGTRLSDEQCNDLATLWQAQRQGGSVEIDQQGHVSFNSFQRGKVGSFGVIRKFGDAGANARRQLPRPESREFSQHVYCQ
jgi:hypothetical protein